MLLYNRIIEDYWDWIKEKAKKYGLLNKEYDYDLDGKIDAEVTGFCSKYDANLDGLIDNADKVDGYDAGTGANQVLVLDSNGLVPLGNVPVLDWSKLQFPGVRQEVLQYFSDPKVLIITSSMLELLNSADKAGKNTGGITATSQELTIPGGTGTATGFTWIYLMLPSPTKRIYACANLNNVNCLNINLELFAGSDPSVTVGGTGDTRYDVHVQVPNTANDFLLIKHVNGVATTLASEAVDLSNNVYYFVEMFLDNDNSILKVWRDGTLKFSVTPDTTNLPSITAVRFLVNDASTTAVQTGKVKGPVVVIYE